MRRLSLVILIAFLFSALAPIAALAAPGQHANQNGLSPAPYLNSDGTLNIPEDFSGSFDLRGWDVRLDPKLGPILQPVLAPLDNWEALADNGLNSTVTSLAVVGTDLYVGGGFGQSSGGATTGLPSTGFAPGTLTQIFAQPDEKAYAATDLVLEIPTLDVEMDIVGVPLVNGDWDVSWLGSQAGYLYGTAYPTWVGNSVLTAHVWNADNRAGPFYHLKDLQYGDRFYIHAFGSTYTYEVRSNALVSANNLRMLEHSDYSLVTLITCESFNEASGEYLYRRAVQAVLVSVE